MGSDHRHRSPGLERAGHEREDLVVVGLVQVMLLLLGIAHLVGRSFRAVEDLGEVQPLGLPEGDGVVDFEQVGASDEFVHVPDAELGHVLACFARHHGEEVHHVVGLAARRGPRSSGSWVATPTGQVFLWQARIMTQPSTTRSVVAKPNSSAPSSAPMTTSRPVLSWPSTCRRTRLRRPFSTSVCWVSARPSSQGAPA